MKKMIALLLSALLCVMTALPVMAEGVTVTTPATFSFTLEAYKTFYDLLAQQVSGAAATWTTAEDGTSVTASVEGIADLQLYLDEQGAVQYMTVLTSAGMDDLTTMATSFGMTVAFGGMAALYFEDMERMDVFEEEFNPLFQSILGQMGSLIGGEVAKVTGTLAGLPTVLTMSIDMETMSMTLGFFYGPEGTIAE